MSTINEIFRTFAGEYLAQFGNELPPEHRKAIEAIGECRTEQAGIAFYECESCGHPQLVYQSCGNRHCPTCQHQKSTHWLHTQLGRQLPGHHFMVTFTVPQELRRFLRSHQRIGYSALFKSSSQAIRLLAADPKHMGGDLPGFFGVLHTWGRTLEYHPHIHYIAAGGCFDTANQRWHSSRIDFYLPVKALSKIYRAKFRDEMEAAGLLTSIDPKVWKRGWNVNCQAVGESSASLGYLAPYVFKVAISNNRILKVDDHAVSFRYKKSKSERWRTMTLDVLEFMRRFLQHVLPSGFMKVRYFGFMNPNCKVGIETISALIQLSYGFAIREPEVSIEPVVPHRCPLCGGRMRLRALSLKNGKVIRPG